MGVHTGSQGTGQLFDLGKVHFFKTLFVFLLKTLTCLPETGQEGTMHSGRIIPDGVLPTKEDARWVLDHVIALARVAWDDGGGEDVVVVATCTSRDKAVAASVESKG